MKSLQDLKKIRITSPRKDSPPAEKPGVDPVQDLPADEGQFLRAMQGVKPLEKKGRDIAPVRARHAVDPVTEDDSLEVLSKLVSGQVQFDIEHSDEYIQGYVQGINLKTFRKLKTGTLSIQAHLDLHGLNTMQARTRLLNFMREQYISTRKCVLIIPGRGRNSPLGSPVLRSEVQSWLTREPLKRIVLAFCTARPEHGGTGAFYVLLRDYKKTGGKVIWDRFPTEMDEF